LGKLPSAGAATWSDLITELQDPYEDVRDGKIIRYWQHPSVFIPKSIYKWARSFKFYNTIQFNGLGSYEQVPNKYIEAMFEYENFVKEIQEEDKKDAK